jgi:hypothetical protein
MAMTDPVDWTARPRGESFAERDGCRPLVVVGVGPEDLAKMRLVQDHDMIQVTTKDSNQSNAVLCSRDWPNGSRRYGARTEVCE